MDKSGLALLLRMPDSSLACMSNHREVIAMKNLKFERCFFEIGVYICSPDEFYAKRTKKLQENLEWATYRTGGTRERAVDLFVSYEAQFLREYGGWRYTQAVGWVRLYVLGDQIQGDIWFVGAKRVSRRMNKRKFEYFGKAFELSFFPGEDSSSDIYCQVRSALENLSKEKPFRRRYLDLEAFYHVGPFINWRALIGLE